ncbi:MAG: hypothetical protein ACFFCP_19405 [Promethearchaeota archaeon]
MIREIFLIDRSVLQFHYSSEESLSDDDKAVLSSGFLSAIQDFSAHARSDVLDSFSTENEYFLYLRFPDSEKVLVGVFDKKAPEAFAREAMEKIMGIFQEVEMPDIEGLQLSPEKKDKIRSQISLINVQLFNDDQLSSIVISLLEKRSDIPLAFLIDSSDNSIIASFSRPRPLFKESQVREFLLVHSTIRKVLENLEKPPTYSYFVVESDDYIVVACNGGRLLSVASGAMKTPIDNVYSAAASMCYVETVNSKIDISASSVVGELEFQDSLAGHISGMKIPTKVHIFIPTLAKNIDSMFRSLTRRPFSEFYAVIIDEPSMGFRLTKKESSMKFELLQF